jgi:uncharacterized protein YoxC
MLTTVIIGVILLLISISLNVYFIKKLNKLFEKLDEYNEFIDDVNSRVNLTYNKLKELDNKQMFEKDDDVGFVFTNILKLIEKLKSSI